VKGFHLKALALATALATTPILGFSTPAPGITLLGMGGPYLSAWADGMLPIKATADSLTYADLQLEGNTSNSGIVSLGSGYRRQSSDAIWGAYLFYDRERSSAGGYYNVASPGVEYLTKSWKYRLNYYAPFGTKTHIVDQGWADEFGNFSYIEFTGHQELDQWGYKYESLSYGGDVDVAYRFQADNRWEVSLSPYVFNRNDSSTLVGANAKLSFYEGDYATLFIGDGYDNASHNRVFVGASFNISGRNNDDTLSNLMMSPVYRNLDVNTTSNGLPVSDYTEYSGVEEVEEKNIYFIEEGNSGNQSTAVAEDGTYENPYTSIDSINTTTDTKANFWVADRGSSYTSATGTLTLGNDQSLEGRSSNYKHAASGSDTPVITAEDGLVLNDNTTVSGITLNGSGTADSVGITVNGDATINEVTVGTSGGSKSFTTGVELTDGATAAISDSIISAYSNTFNDTSGDGRSNANAIGVKEDGNNALTIVDSTINSTTGSLGGSSRAVQVGSGSAATISDSTLNASGDSGLAVMGLFASSAGAIDVSGSTITSSSSGGAAYGAYLRATSGDVNIDDSVINVTATASSTSGSATGVYVRDNVGSVSIADSTFNIESNASNAMGVRVSQSDPVGAGLVTVTGNTFNLVASSPLDSYDIYDPWGFVSSSDNVTNKSIN
jgi:hypothetical protein